MQLEGSDHQCSFRRTIENMIHSLAPSLLFHFSQVSTSPSFVIPTLFCVHSMLCLWIGNAVSPCLLDRYQHSFVMKLLAHPTL